jgi:hypothetical protein
MFLGEKNNKNKVMASRKCKCNLENINMALQEFLGVSETTSILLTWLAFQYC